MFRGYSKNAFPLFLLNIYSFFHQCHGCCLSLFVALDCGTKRSTDFFQNYSTVNSPSAKIYDYNFVLSFLEIWIFNMILNTPVATPSTWHNEYVEKRLLCPAKSSSFHLEYLLPSGRKTRGKNVVACHDISHFILFVLRDQGSAGGVTMLCAI